MKIFITLAALVTFNSSAFAEKEFNTSFDELFFYPAEQAGFASTELIIEEKTVKGEFGNDQVQIYAYFESNGQEYEVKAIDWDCNLDKEKVFPFRIYASFPKDLDYELNRADMFFGTLHLRYKLRDGTIDSYFPNEVLNLFGFSQTLDRKALKEFSLGGGEDNPLSLNMRKKYKECDDDFFGCSPSRSDQQMTVNIPIMNSEEKYSFTIKPFNESWLDLYDLQCPQSLDTSAADSIDF